MSDCLDFKVHHHDAKVGCSKAAHRAMGWCSGLCSSHTPLEECVGWRLLHLEDDPHTHGDKGCPEHKLVQHRDRKPPWCNRCGRDKDGHVIGRPKSWLKP